MISVDVSIQNISAFTDLQIVLIQPAVNLIAYVCLWRFVKYTDV